MVHYSSDTNRYNITVNATQLRLAGTLRDVIAHEVAHLLDPSGFQCDGAHEPFADSLGPLLLEHSPTTLEEAEDLARHVVSDGE